MSLSARYSEGTHTSEESKCGVQRGFAHGYARTDVFAQGRYSRRTHISKCRVQRGYVRCGRPSDTVTHRPQTFKLVVFDTDAHKSSTTAIFARRMYRRAKSAGSELPSVSAVFYFVPLSLTSINLSSGYREGTHTGTEWTPHGFVLFAHWQLCRYHTHCRAP